jgi:hypothetical protein
MRRGLHLIQFRWFTPSFLVDLIEHLFCFDRKERLIMFVDPIWVEVQRVKHLERQQEIIKLIEADRCAAAMGKKSRLSPWLARLGDGFIAIGLRLKAANTLDSTTTIATNFQQPAQR